MSEESASPAVERLRTYLLRPENELPIRKDVGAAATEILRLHEANGGATFSLFFGNQAGERLYSVSIFPDRSYVTEGQIITREEIEAFMASNLDLLSDPRCCVGTWYSAEADQAYLDISVALPNKRDAISLGKRYNQEGIFNLFRMEYIPTGGSGEPPEKMPPVMERLSEQQRGKQKRS